jgi:hypothetical protein
MWRHRNVAAMKETFIINFHFWGQNTPCLSQLVLEKCIPLNVELKNMGTALGGVPVYLTGDVYASPFFITMIYVIATMI